MSFNEHGAHSWRRPLSGGLHSYVVNELGGEIAQGKLAPNEIINVNGLCERFGVSRSVVRESLRALESLGLVKARPQVGTRVMALENWDLLNARGGELARVRGPVPDPDDGAAGDTQGSGGLGRATGRGFE